MLTFLLYISLITGGILFLSLILSLVAGLDLDFDVDLDGDGGVGYFKGGLAFISIGTYVVRTVLISSDNIYLAVGAGLLAGVITILILSAFLRWLISQQEEVNYSNEDALFQTGIVYLKIPKEGQGIIRVNIKGVEREFKATTKSGKDIPTGESIIVESVVDNVAQVSLAE